MEDAGTGLLARASPVAALPVGFLFPPAVSRPLAVSRLSQRKPAYERIFASRIECACDR